MDTDMAMWYYKEELACIIEDSGYKKGLEMNDWINNIKRFFQNILKYLDKN